MDKRLVYGSAFFAYLIILAVGLWVVKGWEQEAHDQYLEHIDDEEGFTWYMEYERRAASPLGLWFIVVSSVAFVACILALEYISTRRVTG